MPYLPASGAVTMTVLLLLAALTTVRAASHGPQRDLGEMTTRLYLVHMIFMILAWLLLAPLAILVARYGRTLFTNRWYSHHRNIQIATVLFVIVGFSTAIAAMYAAGSKQFNKAHHQVGVAIFILVFLQAALGLAAHRIKAAAGSWGNRLLGLIHAPIGLLLFGLAMWNIQTGFDLWEWEAGDAPKIFVYAWMGFLILLYLIGLAFIPREIKQARRASQEKKNEALGSSDGHSTPA